MRWWQTHKEKKENRRREKEGMERESVTLCLKWRRFHLCTPGGWAPSMANLTISATCPQTSSLRPVPEARAQQASLIIEVVTGISQPIPQPSFLPLTKGKEESQEVRMSSETSKKTKTPRVWERHMKRGCSWGWGEAGKGCPWDAKTNCQTEDDRLHLFIYFPTK